MAQILVTGSHGYLGASTVARLTSAGHDVTCLAGRLADVQPARAAAEYVVHTAGALRDAAPDRITHTNVAGTRTLLAALAPATRVIFVSSRAVYGTPRPARIVTEDTPPTPDDPYGLSKLEAEALVEASGRPFIILRPTLLVGRGVSGDGRSFLNRFIDAAVRGLPLQVHGGEQLVDPIYVEDLAGHITAFCGPGPWWGEVFNVSGARVRLVDVARRIAELSALHCGRKPVIELHPRAEPAGVLLDARKLASFSPYRPVTPFDEILVALIRSRQPPSL
jgi:nucleoside-diphosphate-sugar epimerase